MLKVWGRRNSLNVPKALFCMEELGLPYERVDAGMHFGVVKTPEYMAMNPNSVVPTIEDDGFVLWESNVIVRYLAASHGAGTLWPVDPRARAEELTVAFDVQEAYFAVHAARSVLRSSEDAFERSRVHRDLARAGVDGGLRPPIELTRAEAEAEGLPKGGKPAVVAV